MVRAALALGVSGAAGLALAAIRTKLVALELGPSGIGTLGILLTLVTLLVPLAELGLGSSAMRRIAAAHEQGDLGTRDATRRALYLATAALGVVAAAVVVAAAEPLADLILGDEGAASTMRLAGVAIGAGVASAGPVGELIALRRVRALAISQALAAAAATGATAVAYASSGGLVETAVLAPTAATLLAALAAARSLPARGGRVGVGEAAGRVRALVPLGVAFAAHLALFNLGALVVRLLVDADLGRFATGEFQAAATMSALLLGFIVSAQASDFVPLLSGMLEDRAATTEAVRAQLRVSILLATPAVLGLIAFAPLAVSALYSREFDRADALLQVMLLGEIPRVAAWTFGSVLVARGAARLFLTAEVVFDVVLIAGTWLMLEVSGLEGAVLAAAAAQVAGMAVAWRLLSGGAGVAIDPSTARLLFATSALAAIAYGLTTLGEIGPVLACVFALFAGGWAVLRLIDAGASRPSPPAAPAG